MQKLGYQCVRVIGYVGDEHHAWCMAKLDGEWYHIDPTWGDPQSYEEDERGADAGYINYDYLNLTS
jgi:transglutaminase/protease-like cytokinesis protein 3